MEKYSLQLANLVQQALHHPKNLATESELVEYANSALSAFLEADVDSTETLSSPELIRLCSNMGLPMEDDEEEAFMKIDADDSGQISVEEWIIWWLKRVSCLPNPLKQQEAIARNTFKKFDTDDTGSLDTSELYQLISSLGANFPPGEMKEVVSLLDTDDNGCVDVEEFINWWVQRSIKSRSGGGLVSLKLRKLARKAAQLFYTDIFTAVWNNDLPLVKLFLESDRRMGSASDTSEYGEGWTPLHYASYRGHESIVRELIEGNTGSVVNVNAVNDLGFSPLFYACQSGHIEICEMLLKIGADPSISGGPSDLNSNLFMCPIDHCTDNKDLMKLFKSHPLCLPAEKIPTVQIKASVTRSKGILSIELPPVKSFSTLPIKKWKISVHAAHTDSADDFEKTVDGIDPRKINKNSQNCLEVMIDKKWLVDNTLSDGNLADLTLRISAVNSWGGESSPSDVIPVTRNNTVSKTSTIYIDVTSSSINIENNDVFNELFDENFEENYEDTFINLENDEKYDTNDETMEKIRREIDGEEDDEELIIIKGGTFK